MTLVTITQASTATGVSAKMIRHYESIGPIKAPLRTENRYRHYAGSDLHDLGFIRRSRDLGFSSRMWICDGLVSVRSTWFSSKKKVSRGERAECVGRNASLSKLYSTVSTSRSSRTS